MRKIRLQEVKQLFQHHSMWLRILNRVSPEAELLAWEEDGPAARTGKAR